MPNNFRTHPFNSGNTECRTSCLQVLQNGEDRGRGGLEVQQRGKEGGVARAAHRWMKVGVRRLGLVDGVEAVVVGEETGGGWVGAAASVSQQKMWA
jgi:hypothetical protein